MEISEFRFTFTNATLTQKGKSTSHKKHVIDVQSAECPTIYLSGGLMQFKSNTVRFNPLRRGKMNGEEIVNELISVFSATPPALDEIPS